MANEKVEQEFDRQVENLLQKGHPKTAGLTDEEFLKYIEPLKNNIGELSLSQIDLEKGYLPFVIVIRSILVPTENAMLHVLRAGKEGVTKLYPHEPKDFAVTDAINIPSSKAYLLIDIDRGKETLNIPPQDALKIILKEDRLPLTIDEGVAIITHFPEFLQKNNCFSLLASRHSGDQRVPAIWINREKKANLGWCWNGNPHTWLGSASCKRRLGY